MTQTPTIETPGLTQRLPLEARLSQYNQAGVIPINTVLLTLDCVFYRSISIQCTAMGTSGVVAPEWSNDNTTWVTANTISANGIIATTFNGANIWTTPVVARYFRLRMSTATTGGTTTFSLHQFDDSRQMWQATQAVAVNGGTNAIGDVGIQYRNTNAGAAGSVSVLSPATPAAATVKASSGRLLGYQLQNSSASLRSVKIFNATAPTLGTTAAAFEIDLPAGAMVTFNLEGGIGFATAITYSVTSAKGLTDNTATGLAANDVSGAFFFA